MRKIVISFLSIVFCLIAFSAPSGVLVTDAVSLQNSNLTIVYEKDDVCFENVEIRIYRIAKNTDDGNFEKISPYDSYPVSITDISSQVEWTESAATFMGYIKADSIKPYEIRKTNSQGKAVFSNIEKGLYLVEGVSLKKNGYVYNFFDFMINLPADEDNIIAKPKSDADKIIVKEKTYSIMKLWQDGNNSNNRPDFVVVDILKNGELYDTVTLDSTNNWRYTFKSSEPDTVWSVAEKNISMNYTVKVTKKDTDFVIVNTLDKTDIATPDTSSPQTGDIAPLSIYIILFSVSGLVLIILGAGMRRKDNANQK